MSKYLTLIFGCLLCALSSISSDEVPAIAISCGNTPLQTLPKYQQTINTLEFKKILSHLWNEDTKIVIVLEDQLSFEDFSLKDINGHSLLPIFENAENHRFFPSVYQPEKSIEMLSKNGFSVKTYNDNLYVNNSEKILALIDFDYNNHYTNDDSRETILLKHNNDISKIFNNLCKQYTNIVLVFSGKINPWIEESAATNAVHLVTRHLMAANSESEKLILDKGIALIYSSSYPYLSVDNESFIQLKGPKSEVFQDGPRDSLLKVGATFLVNDTKITLRFRFEKTSFTWELKLIEYVNRDTTIPLTPQKPISALLGLSYYTEGPVIFSHDSTILKFNDEFQVESWMSFAAGSSKFSDPQEQNSLFTPPILAGLFVITIMLLIVTWGITMIMDIKTMDRFDDPKGKTISINTVD